MDTFLELSEFIKKNIYKRTVEQNIVRKPMVLFHSCYCTILTFCRNSYPFQLNACRSREVSTF